jgi:hypothetical protein
MKPWNKCGRSRGVVVPCLPEHGPHPGFFTARKAEVSRNENWEHDQSDHCRPLEQKAGHDRDEPCVLRMPDPGIGSGGCEPSVTLRVEKHLPGG